MENREQTLRLWLEPFVELRAPTLVNLRRDPFEKAQHNANTYSDWMIDRIYLIAPIVEEAAKFLMTFKDYPPSGMAGSFNLTKMQKQIEEASKGGK
jgi:arylsulfatase